MNFLEFQLQTVVKFLSAQKIKYVILGGIAASIYGEPRLTADIDISIILDKDKISEFLIQAKRYNIHPSLPNIKKIARKTGILPMHLRKRGTIGRLDIIIAENILEYTAIKRGRLRKINSIKARIISPEDLIIHKITSSRPRDLEDLRGILIRQKGKLDIRYIQEWLKKIDKVSKETALYKLFKRLLKES